MFRYIFILEITIFKGMISNRVRRELCSCTHILYSTLVCLYFINSASCIGEVVWSVNAGGDSHTDIDGIYYQSDTNPIGIASDYGKNMFIQRVGAADQILYQTERYATSTFFYEIPVSENGPYVLVMKFSEVWFTLSGQKVFDIMINQQHLVVESLDIFDKVGRASAHDEVVPFEVKSGRLIVGGESSKLISGHIRLEFVKGERDNPKVNAIYVMKGTPDDIPELLPLPGTPNRRSEEEELEEDDEDEVGNRKSRRPIEPRVADPYAADDTSSMMLPVFISIAAFIPLLFCLCKL